MNQKETAIEFLRMCATGSVDEAYQWFASPSFKHHNQFKVFEDGDTVITYSKVDVKDNHGIAVVHISRFLAGTSHRSRLS